MKIRNLLIASLAVFAFASCSKDEGNEPEKPRDPVDAVFSIQLTSDLGTKAINGVPGDPTNSVVNEAYVNTLNTYVFNASTGALAAHTYSTVESAAKELVDETKGLTGVKDILVKVVPNADGTSSKDEFKMVLIANLTASTPFNSLKELEEAVLDQDIKVYNPGKCTDTPLYLPMRSGTIAFGKLHPSEKNVDGTWKHITNWVKADGSVYLEEEQGQAENQFIKLKRMIARVQIDQIKMDLTGRYPNASFQLRSMSLANVRSSVTLNALGTGKYLKGYQSDKFNFNNGGTGIIVPAESDSSNVLAHFIRTWPGEESYKGNDVIFSQGTDTDLDLSKKHFCSYVFPNSEMTKASGEYNTGILLAGMFKVSENADPELRHYWVPLNKDGKYEVLSNTIYRLSITINGEGSKDEDKPEITAGVEVAITVANWILVEQIEDDEN